MPKFSIIIPTYEMGGIGHDVIQHALSSLHLQSFKDFEIIVSDQSKDDKTEEVCSNLFGKMNIVYTRFLDKFGCYTANTNNAIRHASGEILKFLDADDFLYDEDSLKKIDESFSEGAMWVASDYVHSYDRVSFFNRHSPYWNDRIYLVNTIGSPTGVAVRASVNVMMDENVRWLGDADMYKSIYDICGRPKFLHEVTAVHLLWEGQNSNTLAELQRQEEEYVINKYEGKIL